ncbi:MAG: hypothetical protein ACKVRN_07935 [Pyrinomonadaceae bacterium]
MSFPLILLPIVGASQDKSKDEDRIKTAVEQSKVANDILKQVAALPEAKGIPKKLTEKMNSIGVTPGVSVKSLDSFNSNGVRGVTSLRQDNGWSLPAFFIGKGVRFDLAEIGAKHFDLVVVIVNARFKRKNDKNNNEPPDKKDKSDKPQIYFFYAFANGVLKPITLKSGNTTAMGGAHMTIYDDKLNKAVFGAKGEDIHLFQIDAARQIPREITAFRDTLDQLYPAKK